MSRVVPILFVILCALLIACGGGGGGGTATSTTSTTSTSSTTSTTSTTSGTTGATTTQVKLTVNWAARSRAVDAPSAALSAVITVFGGIDASTDYKFTINRNTAPAAYTQSYTSPGSVRKGTLLVDIAFYGGADGTGSVVASGAADVDFSLNGGDIGNITIQSIIQSVTIPPNQSVAVGQTKDLLVECRDSDLNLVAVSPGAVSLNVTSGATFLGVNGPAVVGLAGGVGSIVAQVNGVSSPGTPVNITGGGATGTGRIFFVADGPIIKSMSGDGSDLQVVLDGTGVFSAISSTAPNHNRTKLAFAGTKAGLDSTLFLCNPDGTNLIDLFETTSPKPDGPFEPRWSLAPTVANNSATGLDLLWFIAVVPSLGLSAFSVDTITRTVLQSSAVEQISVGSWTATDRPLLGLSLTTGNGWHSTIDGTQIDQDSVGLSQLAIGSTTGTSFYLVAVDASSNLRRYNCNIVDDGSGGITVEVASSQVLTTSGGYSNPSISPDGSMIAAQRGPFEASEIVTMSSTGANVVPIATGRQPFWR